MDEQKIQETRKEVETIQKETLQLQDAHAQNTGSAGTENALSLIERAEAATARIEKAEAEIKATEQRLQEERAKQILGGRSYAGQVPVPPKETTPEEYAKLMLQGKVNPLAK